MDQAPVTANATFCATIIDQWQQLGLTHAFVAPGSRSTPVALALIANPEIQVSLFHDERSASFAALGHALSTGVPSLVLCSSGTAGAHFFAAVIEADLSAVPLLVCTADRPPELWGRGAPQVIDQTELYGNKVRAFFEPGPPDDTDPAWWRGLAQQAWAAATGPTPGPVHCNLSFRDPLTGTPGELPDRELATIATQAAPAEPDHSAAAGLGDELMGRTGVIIAGRGETPADEVLALAERLGWPVLADHRSGCRVPDHPNVVNYADALLRHQPFAESHHPDFVLRVGEILSSKALSQWLATDTSIVVSARPHRRRIDPEDIANIFVDEAGFVASLTASLDDEREAVADWLSQWTEADATAAAAIATTLNSAPQPNEIDIARATLAAVPTGGALVMSSSMPVRDIEWYGGARSDIAVYSNRGANGIDGVIATAVGVALTGVATVLLIGDVALLHDSSSLVDLAGRDIDLTIVVPNNDGGGIFSFLPQHQLLGRDDYEFLFGTPHGSDLVGLCRSHGLAVNEWPTDLNPDGVQVVVARTDRAANLELHDNAVAAVAAALTGGDG